MAYASIHSLLTYSGTLPGGEVWSCGVRTTSHGVIGDGPVATAGPLAVTAFSTFWGVTANAFGTTAIFELLRWRIVDTSGVTLALYEFSPASPVAAASAVSKPNQCAIVLTLNTAFPSRRGRGRVYLPAIGTSTISNGKIAATQRDSIATTAKTWLDSTNTALNGFSTGVKVGVQSQVGAGQSAAVTTIRVGDVMDTQRRRRDNLIESYTSRTLA